MCVFYSGTNGGYREEPVDHRLTDREWADEWRHLDHVSLQADATRLLMGLPYRKRCYLFYLANYICTTYLATFGSPDNKESPTLIYKLRFKG